MSTTGRPCNSFTTNQIFTMSLEVTGAPLHFGIVVDTESFDVSGVANSLNALLLDFQKLGSGGDVVVKDLIRQFDELNKTQLGIREKIGLELDPTAKSALQADLQGVLQKMSDINGQGKNFKDNFSNDIGKAFVTANNSAEVLKRNLDIALDPKVQADKLARRIEKTPTANIDGIKAEIQADIDRQVKGLEFARDRLAAVTKKALTTTVDQTPAGPKTPPPDDEVPKVEKTVAAYTRLKQVKNEIAAQRVVVPPGGFKDAEEEAIAYQTALRNINKELLLAGKNTAGISALKEGVRGLVGAFEAVSGAIALFGGDSKEAEEATKAVIGAMGILNGIEEITALLSKGSAVNFYLESVAHKTNAVATAEDAAALALKNSELELSNALTDVNTASTAAGIGAKEADIVATEGATAAQIGLNTAMELNPVGILLLALVGLFAAYETYINTLGKATDAEKTLKAAREAQKEIQDKAAAGIAAETGELNRLVTAGKSDVLTREQKQDAINEAIAKNPEYLSGLNLENIATQQGIDLITKQTNLIRARSLVKASSGVVDKAIEEQIKAQNDLNDVLEHGATLGQKINAAFISNTGRRVGESNEAAVIREKEEALADATLKANAAIGEQNKATDNLGKQFQTDSEKIKLYIEQLDRIIDRGFGVERTVAQISKALATPFALGQQKDVPAFDPAKFDAKQKNEAEQQQAFIDGLTIAGTQKQINARRDLLHQEYANSLNDQRIYNPITGGIKPGSEGAAAAAKAKLLKGLHDLDIEAQGIENKSEIANAESLAIHLQAIGRESTAEYHAARLQAIKDAAAVALRQEALTAGEARRIRAQLELDLANERVRYQKSILDAEISGIQAKLNLVKKGTAEELNLGLERIEIERQKELEAIGLTAQRKAEIESDAQKKRADLLNSYLFKQIKDEAAGQQSIVRARLVEVQKGSDEELQLQRQLIREKKDAAEFDVTISTDGEVLKARKIAEIQAQARAEEAKLDEEAFIKKIDGELTVIDQTTRRRKNKDDLIISDPFSSDIAKFEAAKDKIDADIVATESKINELQAKANASHGDTTALKKEIEDLKIQLEVLRAQAGQIDAQAQIKGLERTAAALGNIAASAGTLSASLKGVNEELSAILGTLSAVTIQGQNAVLAIKKIATGKAANAEKPGSGLGDILGGAVGLGSAFFSVVGIINGIIGKAAEKRRQERIKEEAAQVVQINGEIAINDKYRERLVIQSQINKLKYEAIKAEAAALAANKISTEKDFADILSRVQALTSYDPNNVKKFPDGSLQLANGTIIPANQVATFGQLAGKSFDDLEKLFLTGQLEGKAKDLFTTLEKLKQEGVDIDAALAANAEKRKEAFAGTSAQNIVDTIKDGFSQGFRSVQDFAGKTEDIIRKAMLNALEAKALSGPIQKIFDQFAADAESGGGLDQTEVANFTKNFNKTIQDAAVLAEQIQKATGVNLTSATGQTNSLTGSIKKELTEQTGTVIAGGINGIRLTNIEQLNSANKTLDQINKIQVNTLSAANGIQDMLKFYRLWTSGDRVKVA